MDASSPEGRTSPAAASPAGPAAAPCDDAERPGVRPDPAGVVAAAVSVVAAGAAGLDAMREALADLSVDAAAAAGLVDVITAAEALKNALAGVQAVGAVALARSEAARLGDSAEPREVSRSVGAQVALARREHPARGGRYLGLARALVAEMPHALAGLRSGVLSEWRATLICRETAGLSAEHRRAVDTELAGRLGSMGDAQIVAETRRAAYRLEPRTVAERGARAVSDRRVTIRPAPDTMCYVTALLPAQQGVAAYAALTRHADLYAADPAGDGRGRGQVMADELVRRILDPSHAVAQVAGSDATGRPSRRSDAAASGTDSGATGRPSRRSDAPVSGTDSGVGVDPHAVPDGVGVDVHLVITDRALLRGGDDPADLEGYGPVPAALARHWILHGATDLAGAAGAASRVWLRRLYTHPDTGQLIGMDSRRRCFPPSLARYIKTRDGTCRTPWCGAPIRHIDHITPAAAGGPTDAGNGQGLCEACNYTKAGRGWSSSFDPDGTVTTTTPTGHSYESPPPVPPVQPVPIDPEPGSGAGTIDIADAIGRRLVLYLQAA